MKFAYPSGAKPLDGYTLKRGIGMGGFGEVYFALSDAGKEVALKRIQRNLDVELRGVRQCLNLKHINLISLWDIKTNDKGESWVVMEYVPGQSLRDIVEDNPNGMPEEQVKDWFVSTSAGVAYLHDHGIVHRDLKPGNVFYDSDQQVIKIGDYGLSKFISCSGRSGQTESVGTFHYMAPEIGKGVYGKEIDIYALGIMLFEMISGHVPYEGESSQEIIMKHLTADPNIDQIPLQYRKVIQKCLAKDPEQRYRNVPEMLTDVPWPEIAAKGDEISRRNSVGPLVLNGRPKIQRDNEEIVEADLVAKKKRSTVANQAVAQQPQNTAQPRTRPKPKIAPGGILFGDIRDSRHEKQNEFHRPPVEQNQVRVVQTVDVANSAPAAVIPDEPIAKAVHSGAKGLGHWWNNGNVSTPVKVAILIASTIAVTVNSAWLLPAALGLGFIYLVYYAARLWFLSPKENERLESNVAPGADPALATTSYPKSHQKQLQLKNRLAVRQWLGNRELPDRAVELLGSLLIATVAAIVFNLLGLAISESIFSASIDGWALFTWMTLTCVAGSWFILIAGKFWEIREGNSLTRRVITAFLGILVGIVAYIGANTLHVNVADLTSSSVNPNFPDALVLGGLPQLAAVLVLFAVLFMVLRWWKQSDPLRKTRLSIWSVGLCLTWAVILSHILNVAPLAVCVIAVVVSISVQLAAPWLHPEDRGRIERDIGKPYAAS